MESTTEAMSLTFSNQRRTPRIIYNDDSCTLRTMSPPHTVESISCALDYLEGTQVDCLCWCVGEQIAYSWPSKVIENTYDLKAKVPSNYAGWSDDRDIMLSLHRQGIDYLPLLIRRAQAQGLMFVASFRMNDTHIKSYPTSNMSPEFWKTHQHYRLWEITDGKSYYNAGLDYSFPEVRNRYQDAILEVATNYDVDGIELDFLRNAYLFQPSEAWRKRSILTRLVRDLREKLEQIGARRRRPFTLILRVPAGGSNLTNAGIDARQWIKERLGDILVISEHSNNYNQVIEPWRSLCHDAGVLLYPSVEAGPAFNVADFYTPQVRNPLAPRHDGSGSVKFPLDVDLGMQRAMAQNFLAQQPDGIYMFNFPCRLAEGRNIMHADSTTFLQTTSVLREMGSLKTLARKDKHYPFYKELPIYVEANRPRQFHQTIPFAIRGKDIRHATVTLRFRWIAEKNTHADGKFRQHTIVRPGLIKIYLNDREVTESELRKSRSPSGRIPSGFLLKAHEIVEIEISGRELLDGENTLSFEMPKFPHERDPYVYIYELEADVAFGSKKDEAR